MPTASRNERKKRRLRRNVTLYRRALGNETIARAKTAMAFYAVLSKLGGEVEVSKADLDTAALNLTKLQFEIEDSAVEGFYMVKLVAAGEIKVDNVIPTIASITEEAGPSAAPATEAGEATVAAPVSDVVNVEEV